jgi:hypothetical protein
VGGGATAAAGGNAPGSVWEDGAAACGACGAGCASTSRIRDVFTPMMLSTFRWTIPRCNKECILARFSASIFPNFQPL